MDLKKASLAQLEAEIRKRKFFNIGKDFYFFFDEDNDECDAGNAFYIVHKTKWHRDFCVADTYIGHILKFEKYHECGRSMFVDNWFTTDLEDAKPMTEAQIRKDLKSMGFTELTDFDETPLSKEEFDKLPSVESMEEICG